MEIIKDLRVRVKASTYFTITIDETSTINQSEYLSVELQFIEQGRRVYEFIKLQVIEDQSAAGILEQVIAVVCETLDIQKNELHRRLTGFGADGCSTMMGKDGCVAALLATQHAPWCVPTHCFAHRVNLVAKVLSQCELFQSIEDVLKDTYSIFSRSPKAVAYLKWWQEFCDTPGLRIKRAGDTRWMSINGCMETAVGEYAAILMKFVNDPRSGNGVRVSKSKKVLEVLLDVDIMLGMRVFHYLLSQLDILTKVCQAPEHHFDDIANMIDTTKASISGEYRRGDKGFEDQVWLDFIAVGTASSPLVYSENGFLKYVAGPEQHPVVETPAGEDMKQVTTEDFTAAVTRVKDAAAEAALSILVEFEWRFVSTPLMRAFALLQPRFWRQPCANEDAEAKFRRSVDAKFAVLKAAYTKDVEINGVSVSALISEANMTRQWAYFKLCMQNCWQPSYANVTTAAFWASTLNNFILSSSISAFSLLAQIMLLIPVGSVENERSFSYVRTHLCALCAPYVPTHLAYLTGNASFI